MIREEARNILESLSSDLWRELHPSQRDALDMAIEALQENESLAKSVNEASELLRKKRPHGEWIFTGRHNVYGGAEIECSNCHNKLMVSPSRWEIGENFCDVCGSRNKKEGEAE